MYATTGVEREKIVKPEELGGKRRAQTQSE